MFRGGIWRNQSMLHAWEQNKCASYGIWDDTFKQPFVSTKPPPGDACQAPSPAVYRAIEATEEENPRPAFGKFQPSSQAVGYIDTRTLMVPYLSYLMGHISVQWPHLAWEF